MGSKSERHEAFWGGVKLIWQKKAAVSQMTVKRFEAKNGPVSGTIASLTRIQTALEKGGIQFIPPDEWGSFGVRLNRKEKSKNKIS